MKVLIVDDDERNRKLLSDLLKMKKLEVVEAETGSEADDVVTPDLKFCIIDLRLPDINGDEVAKRIRKKYPEMPLIVYTASVLVDGIDKLIRSKLFDAVLLKPIQLKDFEAIMARFL